MLQLVDEKKTALKAEEERVYINCATEQPITPDME